MQSRNAPLRRDLMRDASANASYRRFETTYLESCNRWRGDTVCASEGDRFSRKSLDMSASICQYLLVILARWIFIFS